VQSLSAKWWEEVPGSGHRQAAKVAKAARVEPLLGNSERVAAPKWMKATPCREGQDVHPEKLALWGPGRWGPQMVAATPGVLHVPVPVHLEQEQACLLGPQVADSD
jgi:hypothetical protein